LHLFYYEIDRGPLTQPKSNPHHREEGLPSMKIYDHSGQTARILVQSPNPRPPSAPGGFGDIFQNALSEATVTGAAVAAGSGGLAVQLTPAGASCCSSKVAQVEQFLDLLEDYRSRLVDPRVSLKGLDAAVQAVARGREALTPLLAATAEDDGLKDVLNQTLATAELEIIRFRRGDYLPSE
jgi:hypothetical protein